MSVSLVNIGIIVGTLALVLGVTLIGMRVVRWRRDIALRRHGAPMLVMPLSEDTPVAPRPVIPREEVPRLNFNAFAETPVAVRRITPPGPLALPDDASGTSLPDETLETGLPDGAFETGLPDESGGGDDPRVSTGPFRPGEVRPGSPSAHLVAGSQVRFFRAEEGTLEFLPGRLEIVGGDDVGQEIFFARQMGEVTTSMTFGRSEGQPLRHIQLLDPTVSRQHAQMTWEGQRWRLVNLSTTNAVVLNGSPLGNHDQAVVLEDGDRIEMGAVVFVFHGR